MLKKMEMTMTTSRRRFCTLIAAIVTTMIAATGHGGVVGPTLESPQGSLAVQRMAQGKSAPDGSPFVSRTGAPVNPKIYGKTYGQWAAAWWQWAASFPDGMNPVQDEDGRFCKWGQSGPVWFLAGTFGGTGVERNCTIPAGKALFYPLVDSVWIDCPNSSDADVTDDEVRWVLANWTVAGDSACQLTATLDTYQVFGEELPAPVSGWMRPTVRTQSPVFRIDLPQDNIFNINGGSCAEPMPAGKTGRSITEGYWVMLPPLTAGEHVLTLHGAGCDASGAPVFETGVTYHLTVKPGKGN
jgi:hypothetical protein